MPLWSSSTLMGASVLALSTSFVFFACRGRHKYTAELSNPSHCRLPLHGSRHHSWVYLWHQ